MRSRRQSFCCSRDISRRKRQGGLEFSKTRPPHFLQAIQDCACGATLVVPAAPNHDRWCAALPNLHVKDDLSPEGLCISGALSSPTAEMRKRDLGHRKQEVCVEPLLGVIPLQRPLKNHPDREVRIEWETLFLEFSAQMVRACRRESLDVVAQLRSG